MNRGPGEVLYYYVFTVLTIGKDAVDVENRLFMQVMGSIS